MTDTSYQIVFRGDIAIGQPIDQVKARMGQLFKLPPAQVDKLFNGGAVVLKRGLSEEKALQYKQAFAKTGALVSVVSQADSAGATEPSRDLSLAPVGASLSPRAGQAKQAAVTPATDHLSLRPSSGNLLDAGELPELPQATVIAGEWGLAELGAVIESISEEVLPLPIMEAQWDIAEVGADLSQGARHEAPAAPVPNFDIAPVGADLADAQEEIPVPEPDTSHISLSRD